jgi:DNA-directed RNA polymerase subunit alpha
MHPMSIENPDLPTELPTELPIELEAGESIAVATVVDDTPVFDLASEENLTFSVLEHARAGVFGTGGRVTSFRSRVDALSGDGEEGRRKGLGMWMLGNHAGAAEQLASYADSDDVAAFTRARSLFELGRHDDAEKIYHRLAEAHPDHPRPLGGALEAALERSLLAGDTDKAADELEAAIGKAPAPFQGSAEHRYLAGRIAELRRDWEGALENYDAAREADPTHRDNLFRAAHLAERCGLDEEAIEFYEALAHLLPAERKTLLNLGLLYEDIGRDGDAAACYDLVVRADATDLRARLYFSDARAAMDMYYDEDLERKEDRLNQILRIPISDFELSVRARNCLNKMQINTLGDLVCRTEQELLSYKNFGETSLNEIKEILRSKSLRLGMPREEAVASIEAAQGRTTTTDSSDVLNRPVHELQLSIRARRTVETLGCLTLGDVVKHSADELLGMPNFGVTSLQELKSKLSEHNLKLRGE